jgi:hypothetical protein
VNHSRIFAQKPLDLAQNRTKTGPFRRPRQSATSTRNRRAAPPFHDPDQRFIERAVSRETNHERTMNTFANEKKPLSPPFTVTVPR